MKLFNKILCLFSILGFCFSQEMSNYGQCEKFNKFSLRFDLEKARLRMRNILHGFVEKSGVNLEVGYRVIKLWTFVQFLL